MNTTILPRFDAQSENLPEAMVGGRYAARRLIRLLPAAVLLAALAACTSVAPDPYLTTQAVSPVAAPAVTDVSADFAAAYLPNFAGGIQSVRQTVGNDSLHQEIVYENRTALPGENVLTVDIGTPGVDALLRPPSIGRVQAEMRTALPGLRPSIVPVIATNASGIYGYATASTGSGACLYAWQYVKHVMPSDATGLSKLTRKHLSASIRLRYCHPSMTADRIQVLMAGLKLKEMGSETIGLLRFAASSGDAARPVAVVTAEPVATPKRAVIRRAAAVEVEDDWRHAANRPAENRSTDDSTAPGFIDNAVAVPLPETAGQPVTEPVAEPVAEIEQQPQAIVDPVAVPMPE